VSTTLPPISTAITTTMMIASMPVVLVPKRTPRRRVRVADRLPQRARAHPEPRPPARAEQGYDDDVFDRSIEVQILRMRRKIEAHPGRQVLIKTERTRGFASTLG
jgi:hypothetical protein